MLQVTIRAEVVELRPHTITVVVGVGVGVYEVLRSPDRLHCATVSVTLLTVIVIVMSGVNTGVDRMFTVHCDGGGHNKIETLLSLYKT